MESQSDVWTGLVLHYDWLKDSAQKKFRISAQDATDLANETILRAHSAIDELKDRKRIRGWLRRIMTNAFLDEKRRQRLENRSDIEAEDPVTGHFDSLMYRVRTTILCMARGGKTREYVESLENEEAVGKLAKRRVEQILRDTYKGHGQQFERDVFIYVYALYNTFDKCMNQIGTHEGHSVLVTYYLLPALFPKSSLYYQGLIKLLYNVGLREFPNTDRRYESNRVMTACIVIVDMIRGMAMETFGADFDVYLIQVMVNASRSFTVGSMQESLFKILGDYKKPSSVEEG